MGENALFQWQHTERCLFSSVQYVSCILFIILFVFITSFSYSYLNMCGKTILLNLIWAVIGSHLTNQRSLTDKQTCAWLYLRWDPLFASKSADWLSAGSHSPMRNQTTWVPKSHINDEKWVWCVYSEKWRGLGWFHHLPHFLIINTSSNNGTPSVLNPLK